MTTPAAAAALLRSRSYVVLLIFAAIIGAPISVAAYFFLALVSKLQHGLFTSLPHGLGFHAEPLWWPIPLVTLSGLLTALAIRWLPGTAGHEPADGLSTKGAPTLAQLPGVLVAALATLGLGAVLGPEAPLIAMGGGLALAVVRAARRPVPDTAAGVIGGVGSFAAVSTLFGSPLAGAFLLMEAVGLGGLSMEMALLPGLLAAGIGSLIFVGLGHWTGLGTLSLRIPNLPHEGAPRLGEFAWAIVIGLAATALGVAIRWLALRLKDQVAPRRLLLTPLVGAVVGGLAVAYAAGTGRSSGEVLFSGQSALPHLAAHAAAYSAGALVLLVACKSLGYGLSLSAFRGGPVFPSLFIGAAGGIALSHLPGLSAVAGMAMGIGAMCTVMLRLPLTSVLLATLLLFSDGLAVMPLVIVAVVVAYVASARLLPQPQPDPQPATGPGDAGPPGAAPPGTASPGTAPPGTASPARDDALPG